ncbi:MAG: hypothetical protein BroJett018_53880 [Chloroflexota bacterium]|nr:MAG: hypothetical protein BroJett018_53880 [Chloroflexota bacterium]
MPKSPTPEAAEYQEWREQFLSDPQRRALYEQEAMIGELWLQMVEARQGLGITQAEIAKRMGISKRKVAQIERNGYDTMSLSALMDYVHALGPGFSLEVKFHVPA